MVFPVLKLKRRYLSQLKGTSAFTLLELMIAIAIIGILAAIAVPNYAGYINRVRYMVALSEIREISKVAYLFFSENGRYPNDLAEIGWANVKDPWGRPYEYLSGSPPANFKGKCRRDKSTNPVNTNYDLYSMGADGMSKKQFDNKESEDDIVWANDGGYLGYAGDY